MNRLTKEKSNQLILVILVTLAVLGGLYAGLIRYQNDYRAELGNEQRAAEKKLRGVEAAIRRADQVTNELAEASAKLAALEGGMEEQREQFLELLEAIAAACRNAMKKSPTKAGRTRL